MMESLKTLLSRQQKVNGHTCPAPHLEFSVEMFEKATQAASL
jgi:hypothetical protein